MSENAKPAPVKNFVVPSFADEKSAWDWMYEQVDDPCVDNQRFAFKDDLKAMDLYETKQLDGCCGFFDNEIEINGRQAIIGCNYGH